MAKVIRDVTPDLIRELASRFDVFAGHPRRASVHVMRARGVECTDGDNVIAVVDFTTIKPFLNMEMVGTVNFRITGLDPLTGESVMWDAEELRGQRDPERLARAQEAQRELSELCNGRWLSVTIVPTPPSFGRVIGHVVAHQGPNHDINVDVVARLDALGLRKRP